MKYPPSGQVNASGQVTRNACDQPPKQFGKSFDLCRAPTVTSWAILLASLVLPKWSDRIAGHAIPSVLSAGHAALLLFSGENDIGGFGNLAQVMKLFSYPDAVLAGWVHFLAFDLFKGGWQCRAARAAGMGFRLVIPCLVLTFLLGPLGLLAFFAVRAIFGGCKFKNACCAGVLILQSPNGRVLLSGRLRTDEPLATPIWCLLASLKGDLCPRSCARSSRAPSRLLATI